MNQDTDQQKASLKRLFARRLPGKLRQVSGYLQRMHSGEATAGLGKQLSLTLEHSIKSCETFGFQACARLLEQAEIQCHNPDADIRAQLIKALMDLAEELDGKPKLEAKTDTGIVMEPPSASTLALQPLWISLPERERNELMAPLALFGFAVSSQPGDTAGAASVAVVADHEAAHAIRSRLGDKMPPLVMVGDEDSIPARLQAVRAGASAYIVRPVHLPELIEALETINPATAGEPPRVLIVEDSKSQSMHYNKVLKEAGCSTAVVNQPLQVMEALHRLKPELILLDMHMPDCTGLELARVLHQMPGWRSIPMVFLTAEENPDKLAAAMAISGDDFLIKPVKADELKTAVLRRIARGRTQTQTLTRDELTGVLNLNALQSALDNQCALANRLGESLCFAHIDIDKLGELNREHGHAAGNAVLQHLAALFSRRARQSDSIGRLGGDSFGLVLPGCHGDDAIRLIDGIRRDFERQPMIYNDKTLHVHFSTGIASHDGGQAGTLRDNAARALRWAKEAGGNRIQLANSN